MASASPSRFQSALITGASTGIGLELARCFARGGASLLLVSRDPARLEAARSALVDDLAQRPAPRAGAANAALAPAIHTMAADLADPAAPKAVYDRAGALFPRLDALINNAGFGAGGDIAQIGVQAQLDMIQVNIASLFALARLFLPGMIERKSGGILNVASTAAFQAGPHMAVYYATKAFVLSFTEALSHELRGAGVHATALCPGPTRTQFQNRAGLAEASLFNSKLIKVASAASVAQSGYRGFLKRKRLVIPGVGNKLGILAGKLAPRWLPARIAGAINASK